MFLPKRKQNRLQAFDYSSCETYFITICTKDKKNLFGSIVGRPMGAPTLPNVINQLKGYVSKKIGFSVWQKLYYDHIIRDQKDYDEKWQYIDDNPRTWCEKHGITKVDIYENNQIPTEQIL